MRAELSCPTRTSIGSAGAEGVRWEQADEQVGLGQRPFLGLAEARSASAQEWGFPVRIGRPSSCRAAVLYIVMPERSSSRTPSFIESKTVDSIRRCPSDSAPLRSSSAISEPRCSRIRLNSSAKVALTMTSRSTSDAAGSTPSYPKWTKGR